MKYLDNANKIKRHFNLPGRLISLIVRIFGFWFLVSGIVFLAINTETSEAAAASTVKTTNTPIKHLVVIFQENVSFDDYFATYPNATNPSGEPKFSSSPDTPSVNVLSSNLLVNPNGNYSVNPFRFDRSQAMTCDMDHEYPAEQQAYHGGLG